MALPHCALVNLHLGKGSIATTDKKATANIKAQTGADEARVVRNKIPVKYMKPFNSFDATARRQLREMSLPWNEATGERLVIGKPVENSTGITTQLLEVERVFLGERQEEWDRMVDKFLNEQYLSQDFLFDCAKASGTLYDRAELPSISQMRSKFYYQCRITPVPEASDIQEDWWKAFEPQAEQDATDRLATAMKEPWVKTGEMVEHLVDILKNDKRLFDSTYQKISKWAKDAPTQWCITPDPKFTEICGRLEKALAPYNVDALRASEPLRDIASQELDKLRTDLGGLI